MQQLLIESGRPVLAALTKADKLSRTAAVVRARRARRGAGRCPRIRCSSPARSRGWASRSWQRAFSPPSEEDDEDARAAGLCLGTSGGERRRWRRTGARLDPLPPPGFGSLTQSDLVAPGADRRPGGPPGPARRAGHPAARPGRLRVAPGPGRTPAAPSIDSVARLVGHQRARARAGDVLRPAREGARFDPQRSPSASGTGSSGRAASCRSRPASPRSSSTCGSR